MGNISVLMSVYYKDNPDFLDKALDSLKKQTLPAEKVILICDGTIPEELTKVINKWSDLLPIELHGYEINQGLAHALNYGLEFVQTEYIARMDSDDMCYPERFEKQMNLFKNNPELEICGTGLTEFYINKKGEQYTRERYYSEEITETSKSLYKGTPLGHPTVMMTTKLLHDYRYAEDTNMNEDIDLWFRLIRDKHRIMNIREPLLNFRITDGTFKRRSIHKALKEYSIYRKNLIHLFGIRKELIYPFVRLMTRFLPSWMNKKLYFSNVRSKMFSKSK